MSILTRDGGQMSLSLNLDARAEQRLAYWLAHALCALLVAFFFKIQLLAPSGIALFPLYAIPVAIATRLLRVRAGVLWAILATCAWLAASEMRHHHPLVWMLLVNASARLFCFLLVVHGVYASERYPRWLRRVVEGRIDVCVSCRRLRAAGGEWVEEETTVRPTNSASVVRKVCPDCAARLYAQHA